MPTPTDKKSGERIFLYSLSTCVMCRHVKRLLTDINVPFNFADVDLLAGAEKEAAKNEMRKWDPHCSFPMLIINDSQCIIGDEPDLIRKALDK